MEGRWMYSQAIKFMTWRDLQGESQIVFHLLNNVGLLPLSITNWSLVAAESMIFKQSHEPEMLSKTIVSERAGIGGKIC